MGHLKWNWEAFAELLRIHVIQLSQVRTGLLFNKIVNNLLFVCPIFYPFFTELG